MAATVVAFIAGMVVGAGAGVLVTVLYVLSKDERP